jgi:hypothetical protein
MSFKKIKNTLDKDLALQFKGEHYTLEAKTSKSFPGDVCAQWLEIYGFLTYEEEVKTQEVKEVKEVKEKVIKK